MQTHKKLLIGVFLGSFTALTVAHRSFSAEGQNPPLTGQVINNFESSGSDSSGEIVSPGNPPKELGTTDETAGEPAYGFTGSEAGVFDGCDGHEAAFPKSSQNVPEGETLVDIWQVAFEAQVDGILQAYVQATSSLAGDACTKMERDSIAAIMQVAKLYECALTEESGDIYSQAGSVLHEQSTDEDQEPPSIVDLWNYIERESLQIDHAFNTIESMRDYILSPAFGRCPSAEEAETHAWAQLGDLLDDMSTLITKMSEEREAENGQDGDGGGHDGGDGNNWENGDGNSNDGSEDSGRGGDVDGTGGDVGGGGGDDWGSGSGDGDNGGGDGGNRDSGGGGDVDGTGGGVGDGSDNDGGGDFGGDDGIGQ